MEMDSIWTVFEPSVQNWNDFHGRFVPELYLRPEIHEDVVEDFRIIKKLIGHSYFESKFYDVAALKAATTMEMALKLRCKDVAGTEWPKNKPLQKLLQWFESNSYVEVYNSFYVDSLRKVRNTLAHRSNHGFGRATVRPLIENIADLVNGLYEDPELRKERMELMKKLIARLADFGPGLCVQGDHKKDWSYSAWPAFINNKNRPLLIHFYYRPCYQVAPQYLEGNQWVESPVQYFNASLVNISDEKITLQNAEAQRLEITAIQDEKEKEEFHNWLKVYGRLSQPQGSLIFKDFALVDSFLVHLREFYKI